MTTKEASRAQIPKRPLSHPARVELDDPRRQRLSPAEGDRDRSRQMIAA